MSSPHTLSSTDKNVTALSFEAALKELENIVRGLEGGKLSLEDALNAYERGAALRQHCEKCLAEAEMRVQNIVQNAHQTKSETQSPQKRSKAKTKTAEENSDIKTTHDGPASHHPAFDEIPF